MLKTIFVWGSISHNDGCDCFDTEFSMEVAVTCIPAVTKHLILYFDTAVLCWYCYFLRIPHSWTPYVHTGCRTCLYKSSLLYTDSSDRHLSSQYIFQNLICSSPCFFLTCAFQRSLASSVILKYFPVLAGGIPMPLRRIDRWSIFRLLKLTGAYLVSLSVMRHLCVQVVISSAAHCSFEVDSSSVSCRHNCSVVHKCSNCTILRFW
jgi:hypothetical protein